MFKKYYDHFLLRVEDDYVIKARAKMLLTLCFIFTCLIPILLFFNIVIFKLGLFSIPSGVIFLILGDLILTYIIFHFKGYKAAAISFLMIFYFSVALFAMTIQSELSSHWMNREENYIIVSLLLTVLFLDRKWLLYFVPFTFAVLVLRVSIFSFRFPEVVPDNIAMYLFDNSFPLLLLSISSWVLSGLFKRSLIEVRSLMEKEREATIEIEAMNRSHAQQMQIRANHLQDISKKSTDALLRITGNLNGVTTEVMKFDGEVAGTQIVISDIVSRIDSFIDNVAKQFEAVTESSATIDEMMRSIESISTVTANKKKAAEELRVITESGGNKIQETSDQATNAANEVQNMFAAIKLINNVSSQTNLLAMNAAIEAAHAGQFGRGFAVVADEIRTLAEQTGSNSKGILSSLKIIASQIEHVELLSGESRDSFQEVSKQIQEYSQILFELSRTITELSNGASEILMATSSLSDISSDIRNGTEHLHTNIYTIDSTLNNLSEISQAMKTLILAIDDEAKSLSETVIATNLTEDPEFNFQYESIEISHIEQI